MSVRADPPFEPGRRRPAGWDLIGNVHAAEPVLGVQVGPTVLRVHPAEQCAGEACCIHHPSEHPLNDRPLNWRGDRGLMERICDHGVGHPDPDDVEHKRRTMGSTFAGHAFEVHGCDGCCTEPRSSDA